MTQLEKLIKLNNYLLCEAPQYRARGFDSLRPMRQAKEFADNEEAQFRLFRSLVNIRPPKTAGSDFAALQGEYLKEAISLKGITELSGLTPVQEDVYIWQGDSTTLAADAIVNAANSQMLGCFCPCHGCIDNAIHTYAGVELRYACAELMKKQGFEEPAGRAKITPAFNLPAKYVLHTVGPIVGGRVTERDCALLASCYRSCLTLADEYQCRSLAFCCISTGEFHFPNDKAAEIAVRAVKHYKAETGSGIKVIFNVFKEYDYEIYRELLG